MSPAFVEQLQLLPDYLSRHLLLSLTALVAGIALSLPLTFALIRTRALRGPVLMLASIVQTIPGLALLALMVPLLRQIGFVPAVLALVLYSVLPVLRNAVTGIENVDPDLIEAGRGLGMSDRQILLRVQLPLALPVVVAGIRTAAVWVVGIATLSTPVGATSLGNYIFTGLQTQNYMAVTVGCVAAAVLALVLDGLIRLIEIGISRRKPAATGTAAAVLVALLGAGLWPSFDDAAGAGNRPVVIGTKTFTEQYLLGSVITRALLDRGIASRTLDSLGSSVVFDALVAGQIDVYVEYTGTIWANYMNEQGNPGRDAIFAGVSSWLADRHGIEIVARLGFENAYALAMPAANAQALRVRTIDDLAAVSPGLRIGGDYEFFSRPEWTALSDAYGLEFRERVSMDSTLMYAAVAGGEVDVISAFSTDGRIPAFDLAVLADTRSALPPYDAVVLLRQETVEDVRAALIRLDGTIDAKAMRAANRAVDLNGESIAGAAAALYARVLAGGSQ